MPETPLKPAQPKRPFVGSLNWKTDGVGVALVLLGSRDLTEVVSNPLPPISAHLDASCLDFVLK